METWDRATLVVVLVAVLVAFAAVLAITIFFARLLTRSVLERHVRQDHRRPRRDG